MKNRIPTPWNIKYTHAVSSMGALYRTSQSVLCHKQFKNQNTHIQLHDDSDREWL